MLPSGDDRRQSVDEGGGASIEGRAGLQLYVFWFKVGGVGFWGSWVCG